MIPENAGKEMLPEEHLTKSIYSGTWTRMRKDEISVTITTRFDTPSSGKFTHPFLNRAITVREAARIQSFPDTFVFTGNKGSQVALKKNNNKSRSHSNPGVRPLFYFIADSVFFTFARCRACISRDIQALQQYFFFCEDTLTRKYSPHFGFAQRRYISIPGRI